MIVEHSERIEGVMVRASLKDFKKDGVGELIERWRHGYFRLLEWKNTWEIPLRVDLLSTSDHTPYVEVLMKKSGPVQELVEMMEYLGYRNIQLEDVAVELVTPEWTASADEYIIQW